MAPDIDWMYDAQALPTVPTFPIPEEINPLHPLSQPQSGGQSIYPADNLCAKQAGD